MYYTLHGIVVRNSTFCLAPGSTTCWDSSRDSVCCEHRLLLMWRSFFVPCFEVRVRLLVWDTPLHAQRMEVEAFFRVEARGPW